MAQSVVDVCNADDPADPDYDITDFDPARDSDDWCKLAYHQPHKARRQLAKAVALVRSENNPNRFYFNPQTGSPAGLYIQLLRPWMAEQNAAGTANWRVTRSDAAGLTITHIFKVENALADRHYFYVYVRPRYLEHDSYSPDNTVFYIRGNTLQELCAFSEFAPERETWNAAELKQEFEYALGDDGPNCRPER